MNAIAPISTAAGGALTPPMVSDALRGAILDAQPAKYGAGADAHAVAPRPVAAHLRAEAGQVLAVMRAAPRIDRQAAAGWLRGIASAGLPGGPSSASETDMMAGAVALVCGDLPAALLCRDAARIGLSRWKFWPVPAEIRAALSEHGAAWLEREKALLAVVNAADPAPPPADEPPHAPAPAEHDAVRAMVASLKAEVAERGAEERHRGPPARPCRPIHPDALAAMRDASPIVRAARAAAARIRTEKGQ